MKPKTLMFRANGDANSYALIDADTGKWVLSLLANGEMHAAEQIELLERVAQCWNTAPEFAGLPKRKLDSLMADGWMVSGVSLARMEDDNTIKRCACTTGGMVLWWQPEQERVIAPSVRNVMQQALEALDLAQALCEKSAHHGKLLAAYTAMREALAAPAPKNAAADQYSHLPAGPIKALYQAREALLGPAADGFARRCAVAAIDDALAAPQPAQQEPVAVIKWQLGGSLVAHIVGDVKEGDLLYTAPQPVPQQYPVAWLHPANACCVTTDPTAYARGIPLYTAPQQAPQQAPDALNGAAQQDQVAWVWSPASEAWERVHVFGFWQPGAVYAFGPNPPADPQPEPQEPAAWLYVCRKKPTLRVVRMLKNDRELTNLGYKPEPLYTAPQPEQQAVQLDRDAIAVNLLRLAGLDKHKARECAEIVMQVLAAAQVIPPENAPPKAPGAPE